MVVNINLDQLRTTVRHLEQEKISRQDRGFLIRLLRELEEATEKSPRLEGEAHALVQVRLQDQEANQALAPLEEKLTEKEQFRRANQAASTDGKTLEQRLATLIEESFSLIQNIYDAYIYVYDAGHLAYGSARVGEGNTAPAQITPRPNGLTYTVARLGQPMVIPDMSAHPLFAGTGWSGSILGIPLKVGPRVVGVMTVCRRPVQEFSAEEIRQLQALADQAAVEIENSRIERLAGQQVRIDPATGLHNRRSFEEHLQIETLQSLETDTQFSVFLVNIDDIKEVNKRYGRSASDFLLAGIATAAAQTLRKTDFIARIDDHRWGIILSRADRSTAQSIAERIQESVQRKRFSLPEQSIGSVNLSMGVAVFHENGRTPDLLVQAAETALQHCQTSAPGTILFA